MSKSADLGSQLSFAVYSAGLAFNKAYRPLLDVLDLTYPQYLAMLVLWERDGITVSDLGEHLFLDSATLTPLLKRLEAGGRILRRRDTGDQRQVRIVLTDDGRELKAAALSVASRIHRIAGFNQSRIANLRLELTDLRRALEARLPSVDAGDVG